MWLVRLEADPATGFRTAIPGSKVILAGGDGQSLDDISGGGALNFAEGPPYADLPSSEQINLSPGEIAQGLEYRQNFIKNDGDHVGGGMAFGPDGMLYLSTGDGVAFNFADPRAFAVQDPNSLSGKVLRIDPITGRGLADNPFHEDGDSLDLNRSKVYQVGLRNPFSLGFSNDGDLVIADTGQTSYEEINIGPAGRQLRLAVLRGRRLRPAVHAAELPPHAAVGLPGRMGRVPRHRPGDHPALARLRAPRRRARASSSRRSSAATWTTTAGVYPRVAERPLLLQRLLRRRGLRRSTSTTART